MLWPQRGNSNEHPQYSFYEDLTKIIIKYMYHQIRTTSVSCISTSDRTRRTTDVLVYLKLIREPFGSGELLCSDKGTNTDRNKIFF